jgi:hypothetical protein
MSQRVQLWKNYNGQFFLDTPNAPETETIEPGIYNIGFHPKMGFYLEWQQEKFEFPYKVYDFNHELIERIHKTYHAMESNLGILFNGTKGTGKTVTAKGICNRLNLPVILVTSKFENLGLADFLATIPQDVIILIDEYEKIFGNRDDLLILMDGVYSNYADSRRVFIMTTNNLYVNDNLLQRPGRIRYLKTFEDLKPTVIEEIVDDMLIHPELREVTISYISSLETITVDIAKSVIAEINIHQCPPQDFADVFNVKQINTKVSITIKTLDGAHPLLLSTHLDPAGLLRDVRNDYKGTTLWVNDGNDHIGDIQSRIQPDIFSVKVDESDLAEEIGLPKGVKTHELLSDEQYHQLLQSYLELISGKKIPNVEIDKNRRFIIKIAEVESLHYNYRFRSEKDVAF